MMMLSYHLLPTGRNPLSRACASHASTFPPLDRAGFALEIRPWKSKGAGNAGRAMRPQPRVQK
jgi:hypothetical protein